MKKFNVKALSMAIAAAVISSAAGAADSSDLLLKTKELEQAVNGFAAGSNFVATNEEAAKPSVKLHKQMLKLTALADWV